MRNITQLPLNIIQSGTIELHITDADKITYPSNSYLFVYIWDGRSHLQCAVEPVVGHSL